MTYVGFGFAGVAWTDASAAAFVRDCSSFGHPGVMLGTIGVALLLRTLSASATNPRPTLWLSSAVATAAVLGAALIAGSANGPGYPQIYGLGAASLLFAAVSAFAAVRPSCRVFLFIGLLVFIGTVGWILLIFAAYGAPALIAAVVGSWPERAAAPPG